MEDEYIIKLKKLIDEAEVVLVGAGAGLSTAAGYTYTGDRFYYYFGDFIEKYKFTDMYSAGFYNYKTLEDFWGYWCRYIYINRYNNIPSNLYSDFYNIIKNKKYFVLTTNVDHCFQKAGFDKEKLFYTQGDYGLLQCSKPCHNETYDNYDIIKKMVLYEGFNIDEKGELIKPEGNVLKMSVAKEMVPYCEHCKRPLSTNLRADDTFVEDEGWKEAYARYLTFVNENKNNKILFLELGVGYNTPSIIKYNFWKMTNDFNDANYVCINKGEVYAPDNIKDKSLLIDGDIKYVIKKIISN